MLKPVQHTVGSTYRADWPAARGLPFQLRGGALRSRVSRSRIWVAVTSVGPSLGPMRTASKGPVQEEQRPPRTTATW
ncbi:hypothetical protein ACFQ0G_04290 [Streptomyces chiangmaiensis]